MEFPNFSLPELEPGWVWLTGAGPGDPGLLTLHALNGIRQADVIVHDSLVDPRILSLATPNCAIIHAGKRGGKPSSRQPDISARLVSLAGNGHRVVRLKGGDPFVFGRGGEEALALVSAGIPFRVIPGITAGIGGLASAGIPLTHRETNSAVTFLTGHGATGDIPDGLNWPAIAAASPVLVIYMALKNLEAIRDHLLAGGRSTAEPVAIISKATLASEKVVETRLDRCIDDVARHAVEPPAIVVVGAVVNLRASLHGLDAMSRDSLSPHPSDDHYLKQAG